MNETKLVEAWYRFAVYLAISRVCASARALLVVFDVVCGVVKPAEQRSGARLIDDPRRDPAIRRPGGKDGKSLDATAAERDTDSEGATYPLCGDVTIFSGPFCPL